MKNNKIAFNIFPEEGKINEILNKFATFIFHRKSICKKREKYFVDKLNKIHSIKNAMVLLQERIDNNQINTSKNEMTRSIVINDMKTAIINHSR